MKFRNILPASQKSEVYNLIISDLTQVINSELPDIQTGNGVGKSFKKALRMLYWAKFT